MKIVLKVGPKYADCWKRHLSDLLPNSEVILADQNIDPATIDYAVVWQPEPGWLKTFVNLKCIISVGAGIDHILTDPDLPQEKPIIRTTSNDLTVRMREYVCLHVLRIHRRLEDVEKAQAFQHWKQIIEPPAHRRGVGVMGLGNLGGDCAKALAMIGFNVVGWSLNTKEVEGIDVFSGQERKTAFLKRSEILVCLLPLTSQTRGILNAELFATLPKGASLINVARGQHLVEEDLLKAIELGHISSATLDVFEEEPLPSGHAFWAHPNILVTPHIASLIDPASGGRKIADNILRFEAGEPLPDMIDLTKGY